MKIIEIYVLTSSPLVMAHGRDCTHGFIHLQQQMRVSESELTKVSDYLMRSGRYLFPEHEQGSPFRGSAQIMRAESCSAPR